MIERILARLTNWLHHRNWGDRASYRAGLNGGYTKGNH